MIASARMNMVAAILALCSSCSPAPVVRHLSGCWNVNALSAGPVKGRGFFIPSMEGSSLQAFGCDDRAGHNRYSLSFQADRSIRTFESDPMPRYLGFTFEGHIVDEPSGKRLMISSVTDLKIVEEPAWLAGVYGRMSSRTSSEN